MRLGGEHLEVRGWGVRRWLAEKGAGPLQGPSGARRQAPESHPHAIAWLRVKGTAAGGSVGAGGKQGWDTAACTPGRGIRYAAQGGPLIHHVWQVGWRIPRFWNASGGFFQQLCAVFL